VRAEGWSGHGLHRPVVQNTTATLGQVIPLSFPELVGGFTHFLFFIIYGILLPIDELIFFKMVKTTHQIRLEFDLQHIPFLDAEECKKTHEVVIAVSKVGL